MSERRLYTTCGSVPSRSPFIWQPSAPVRVTATTPHVYLSFFRRFRLADGGASHSHEKDPKRRKVGALREYLRSFSNSTYVVFSDGTDVLYTPGARAFFSRMTSTLRLNKPESVIFGAERNCWPMMDGASLSPIVPARPRSVVSAEGA